MNDFKVGDEVMLREDVLQRHSRSVPGHAGYLPAQFAWRNTLKELHGKTGKITSLFKKNDYVSVDFGDTCIGINSSELVKVS